MKALNVSRAVDRRLLAVSGGVLGLLGVAPGIRARIAAHRFATAAVDAKGLAREPIPGVDGAEVVTLDGVPLVVLRGERSARRWFVHGRPVPTVSVLLWQEAHLELGLDGQIRVDVIEAVEDEERSQ